VEIVRIPGKGCVLCLLDRRLDKSAFRKRVAAAGFVAAIPGQMRRASNRPAQLYRLKRPGAVVFFDRLI
jgi:hypothetical protein